MLIVLGATGHVGAAVTEALLRHGETVTAVVRDTAKAAPLRDMGAEIAVADVLDPAALRAVLRQGQRAFLLNPPAAPSTDTDREELRSGAAILEALDGSGLEKVVALSAYGAQAGRAIGDLGTLHAFEAGLAQQPIPATIQRAAYFMTNWDAALETARRDGTILSFFAADHRLPMVSPRDLGEAAARFLLEPVERTGLRYVEGPARYTPADVAAAFAEALGRPVEVSVIPQVEWQLTYRSLGFSEAAAESYAGMTAIATAFEPPDPGTVERGTISLRDHIQTLVAGAKAGGKA